MIKKMVAILAFSATLVYAGLPDPPFKVELKKAEDAATVMSTHASTVLTITSQSGIGCATLVRIGDEWPAQLMIRLTIRGLESLRMENGILYFRTSLKRPKRTPYWRVGKNTTAVPEGMLEITLLKTKETVDILVPGELMADTPEEIHLEWIDFFRK
jgi:hypothetical protein